MVASILMKLEQARLPQASERRQPVIPQLPLQRGGGNQLPAQEQARLPQASELLRQPVIPQLPLHIIHLGLICYCSMALLNPPTNTAKSGLHVHTSECVRGCEV